MKIKINNIFKNIQSNKEKIIINKRRNLEKLNQIYEEAEEVYEQELNNIEYKRKGAQKYKSKFNVLDIFKNKFAIKPSYYVLFVFMIILAGVSVYTNIATYKGLNNESYEVFNNNDETDEKEQVQSSVSQDLQDVVTNNTDTRTNTKTHSTTISTNNSTNTQTNVKKSPSVPAVVPLSFVKPLNGEIIKTYSLDKLLYSKTLESWKTHDGLDIGAEIGQNVKSIEKGIVEKIYDDSFLGTTIIIDHGQGYKSIYSNLDSQVSVKEKQTVKKSTVIAKVGNTAIGEIKDDSHIHFMLMLNNKVIDPTSKIKF